MFVVGKNTYNQQGCIKLVKNNSKDINVEVSFSNKCCSFELSIQRIVELLYLKNSFMVLLFLLYFSLNKCSLGLHKRLLLKTFFF